MWPTQQPLSLQLVPVVYLHHWQSAPPHSLSQGFQACPNSLPLISRVVVSPVSSGLNGTVVNCFEGSSSTDSVATTTIRIIDHGQFGKPDTTVYGKGVYIGYIIIIQWWSIWLIMICSHGQLVSNSKMGLMVGLHVSIFFFFLFTLELSIQPDPQRFTIKRWSHSTAGMDSFKFTNLLSTTFT